MKNLIGWMAVLALAAPGCGSEPPPFVEAALSVDSVTLDGEVDGRVLDEGDFDVVTGMRFSNTLQFDLHGGVSSLSMVTCTPGADGQDPYTTLDSPELERRCGGTFLCDETGCADFSAGDLEVELVEQPDGRLMIVDATSPNGALHAEVVFRETN